MLAKLWAAEPIVVSFLATAAVWVPSLILLLKSFGVELTKEQETALIGFLAAIAAAGTAVGRSQVTSPKTLADDYTRNT